MNVAPGLAGKTSEEAMRVDEVISLVSGVLDKMAGTMFETDAAKKVIKNAEEINGVEVTSSLMRMVNIRRLFFYFFAFV